MSPSEPGCPPIRKQSFRDSGFRNVADPRYQEPRFSTLCFMVAALASEAQSAALYPLTVISTPHRVEIDVFGEASNRMPMRWADRDARRSC
jgi:hypothetical protein